MISTDGPARIAARAALLSAALLNLRIVFGPMERIVARATIDDTFLYLQIARNWARLGVPSFDGDVVTSGFQPLWGGALALLAAAVPDADALVRAACLICVLLNLGTGLLLVRLMERHGPAGASLVAAAAWAAFMAAPESISGMEAPLHGFLFAAALYAGVRGGHAAGASIAGALLAAAVLTRLDFAIVAVPLAVWLGMRAGARGVVAALVPFAIVVPAGLVIFFAWTGDAVPVSGQAKLFWAREAYPLPAWPVQSIDALRTAVAVGLDALRWMTGLRDLHNPWTSAAAVLLGSAGLAGAARHARGNSFAATSLAALVLLALSALTIAAILRPFAGGFWYYQPLRVVIAIVAGFSVAAWPAAPRRAAWVAAAAVFGLGVCGALLAERRPVPRPIYLDRLNAARWLAAEGSLDATGAVGSWNAGQLGYFASPRAVVGLDGFVQDEHFVRDVLKTGDWRGYMWRRGIRYLVDYNQRDSAQAAGVWDPATTFRGLVPLDCVTVVRRFGQIWVLDVSRWVDAAGADGCTARNPIKSHP